MKTSICCVLILILTLGCAGTEKKAEKVVPVVKAQPPVVTRSGLKEIPLLQLEEPKKAPERLYSITMRDSDIKSVLMSFSKESKYNIILDPDVTGTVTMDLKRVTMEQALDTILIPLGYVYQRKANIIRVSKPKLETRMFTLNYLATVRTGTAKVEAKTSVGVEKEAGGTKVESKETADLWKDIQEGLKELLSEGGKLIVNKMASIIVVTDYPANLERVAEFLETVEGTVQRQVLIEARIIEVTLSDEYQMGLNWSYIIGSRTSTQFLGKDTKLTQNAISLLSLPIFQFSFHYYDVETLLNAMAEQGEINIISKPRITTLNNQRAIIKVGTEEVYFEVEEEEETAGTAPKYTYTPKFFTVGVVLDVTPQIGPGDDLTLHIHPVITEKIAEKEYPVGERTATVPIVTVRESSSVVKVKSGQTLVLAGLLMKKTIQVMTGIPLLMDMPLLGPLFRYKYTKKTKTELVVTLTPTILLGKDIDDFTDDELTKIFGTDAHRLP